MKTSVLNIDEVIHQKIRLGIMTLLASSRKVEFAELKQKLNLTDGNLSSHITMLEKNDYVTIEKTFVGRKPLTTIRISPKGRQAFKNYIELLRKVLDDENP